MTFALDELLGEARAAAKLEDFGSDDFLPGLRALLRTYDENAWTEKGRTRNRRRLVGLLTSRLKLTAAFAQHPEVLARPVKQPVFLTGLPRSGTSALFSLLGADPAARPLRLWETQCPDPLPLPPGTPDPRRAAIDAYYAQGREKRPEWTKIHFTSADTPEECVLLHAYAMHGVQMGVEIILEPYASWYQAAAADLRGLYAYEKRLLQLLDWQRPGERWLLKAPAHLWGLDALVATFPDAAIVWNHRDPVACIASACSMTQALMATIPFDAKQLGPAVLEFYARSLDRALAAREKLDAERIFDVPYAEFTADPIACAERLYAHFALPLPPAARDALRAFAAENPEGKHGKHDYQLAEYGLDEERVRARFASYLMKLAGLHE
ncbi:MAG TPA: sulfotransferase [Myxococcota bacterium]|nr:sulfotransferase [Myxococcota bacterium]